MSGNNQSHVTSGSDLTDSPNHIAPPDASGSQTKPNAKGKAKGKGKAVAVPDADGDDQGQQLDDHQDDQNEEQELVEEQDDADEDHANGKKDKGKDKAVEEKKTVIACPTGKVTAGPSKRGPRAKAAPVTPTLATTRKARIRKPTVDPAYAVDPPKKNPPGKRGPGKKPEKPKTARAGVKKFPASRKGSQREPHISFEAMSDQMMTLLENTITITHNFSQFARSPDVVEHDDADAFDDRVTELLSHEGKSLKRKAVVVVESEDEDQDGEEDQDEEEDGSASDADSTRATVGRNKRQKTAPKRVGKKQGQKDGGVEASGSGTKGEGTKQKTGNRTLKSVMQEVREDNGDLGEVSDSDPDA